MAVIGGGGGMLVYSSLAEAEYYKHVNEVTLEPGQWEDKNLKVHGFVEPGSIEERIVEDATVRTFVLEYEGERIKVTHRGPKPDTFRDLAEVVAQGRLVRDSSGAYVLEASELMAKCPSKYEEERRMRGAPGEPSASAGPARSAGGSAAAGAAGATR
ncbi:MAG TPA: cytochrome c maturation protein CcmE [Kofleriaceae bacterium]|nr:cytochrome c maturation protein CcmE [Kofleriaceae bacterium]